MVSTAPPGAQAYRLVRALTACGRVVCLSSCVAFWQVRPNSRHLRHAIGAGQFSTGCAGRLAPNMACTAPASWRQRSRAAGPRKRRRGSRSASWRPDSRTSVNYVRLSTGHFEPLRLERPPPCFGALDAWRIGETSTCLSLSCLKTKLSLVCPRAPLDLASWSGALQPL